MNNYVDIVSWFIKFCVKSTSKETMNPTQNERVEPWHFRVSKPFIYYISTGKRIVIRTILG
jgi:hypothetical protein